MTFVDAWHAVLQENPSLQDYGDITPPASVKKPLPVARPQPQESRIVWGGVGWGRRGGS
jgi:hypothetical protein